MRILLADNNRLFIEAASDVLAADGHEIVAAFDGLEALDRLHSTRPDCCVLDVLMPRLHGDRLCAYIKADPELRTIPVILVTGLAGEIAGQAAAHRADAVLAKGPLPVLMEHLRALVRRAAAGRLVDAHGQAVVGAEGFRPREIVGELVSLKQHYEALLENLGDGLVETDAHGRVLAVNRRATAILGLGEYELLGRWVGRSLEGAARERLQEAFSAVADPAGQPSAHLAIERHGRALHVQLHRVPGEQGEFGVALTLRDVTLLVQGERLRAVAEMAAGVAHDFNNLLSAILARAELVRMQQQTPETIQGMDVIIKAAEAGGAIVHRLNSVARRGQADALVACDLNQIVQEAIDLTRPRWRGDAQRRGVPIQVAHRLAERCTVLGDAGELLEVLTNLILNALDAMPNGGELTIQSESRAGEAVLVVSDTGVGMAPEARAHLFRPYDAAKGGEGTGLGMIMTLAIMERHRGRIEVESEPGRGTTIRLVLPALPDAAPV